MNCKSIFALAAVLIAAGTVSGQTVKRTGIVTPTPWSASYYPLFVGALHKGLPGVADIAPLAKYDQYASTGTSAVAWNKAWKEQVWKKLYPTGIPTWFGYCHAWCVADSGEPGQRGHPGRSDRTHGQSRT